MKDAEPPKAPIRIATRGSPLALAQAHQILATLRQHFPNLECKVKIIRTTGDKLQTAAMAQSADASTKGLFTKELEWALLNNEADLAVHSLKDLPTDLPDGLVLQAVCPRVDVRDVLIYRDATLLQFSPQASVMRGFQPELRVIDLPAQATIATNSTRRQAQLKDIRPDLNLVPIRGNVGTRLDKLMKQPELDATILAAAGLERLQYRVTPDGKLHGGPVDKSVADGFLVVKLEPELMLPCVGQAAIGIETRANDDRITLLCAALNHVETLQCVTAERAFLRAMGGGCQSPVAAYAQIMDQQIRLRAVSFHHLPPRRTEIWGPIASAQALGEQAAGQLR